MTATTTLLSTPSNSFQNSLRFFSIPEKSPAASEIRNSKMPPKRKGGRKNHHHSKPSTSTTSASVSNPSATVSSSKLSEDIIVSILKSLPVKSILRFKCASKGWLSLLSSPRFISMHREETSKNPLNHSFVIHRIDIASNHDLSLLNVNFQTVSLVNPFPMLFNQMDLVGSVNGLVCLGRPPFGQVIMLWNPAMNLCKVISLSKRELRKPGEIHKISLGLAYDSANDDYMIIRIANLKEKSASPEALLRSCAEVYSASLDSWTKVQIDFPFAVTATRSNVNIKGVPYWTAVTYQANSQCKFTMGLVYYDMGNGSFKHVTLPKLDCNGAEFVEWKGNLGIIMSSSSRDREHFVDILVYDEMGMCWNQVSRHGPIGRKMQRPLQCSKDGVILAETLEGKLMLYDPLTNRIKTFCSPGALVHLFEVFCYTESLITVKGMEQVKGQDKEEYCFGDLYADDDDDDDHGAGHVAPFLSNLHFA